MLYAYNTDSHTTLFYFAALPLHCFLFFLFLVILSAGDRAWEKQRQILVLFFSFFTFHLFHYLQIPFYSNLPLSFLTAIYFYYVHSFSLFTINIHKHEDENNVWNLIKGKRKKGRDVQLIWRVFVIIEKNEKMKRGSNKEETKQRETQIASLFLFLSSSPIFLKTFMIAWSLSLSFVYLFCINLILWYYIRFIMAVYYTVVKVMGEEERMKDKEDYV